MSGFLKGLIELTSRIWIRFPRRIHLLVGATIGLIWFYVVRVRRDIVLDNIRKAFPDWPEARVIQTARENYIHYGRCFTEFLFMPAINEKNFGRFFIAEGYENYTRAMQQQKGLFLLTLHIGNWELMAATCIPLKIPIHNITKRLRIQFLEELWSSFRRKCNMGLIREEKSSFDILRVIRRKEVVGFILDQYLGWPVGTEITFFGRKTGAPGGLALFASRTGAPVAPVYNYRDRRGKLHVVFEPEIPFVEQGDRDQNISFMTQVYTSKIEEIVRKHPSQWLWLHRRWKAFKR